MKFLAHIIVIAVFAPCLTPEKATAQKENSFTIRDSMLYVIKDMKPGKDNTAYEISLFDRLTRKAMGGGVLTVPNRYRDSLFWVVSPKESKGDARFGLAAFPKALRTASSGTVEILKTPDGKQRSTPLKMDFEYKDRPKE